MNEAMTLTFAAAVPFLLLGLVLLLARLEDTLTDGLETAALAAPGPAPAAPAPEPAPAAQPAPAFASVIEVGPAGVAAA